MEYHLKNLIANVGTWTCVADFSQQPCYQVHLPLLNSVDSKAVD